jgi:hypothetical protein
MAASVLGLAAIECVERKKDLTGLAPKDRLIPTEPVDHRFRGEAMTDGIAAEDLSSLCVCIQR